MKKRVVFIFALIYSLLILSYVSSAEIDSEIKRITTYAEEYESGNINYAQLAVYLSSARQKMNEIFGATDNQEGGLLREEQLVNILGKETEKIKWVWNEKKQKEEKRKTSIPVWKKIVFDGRKIRIWINAWPSLFGKDREERIVYRLDIRIEFKNSEKKFDIENEITEIKTLAESYQKNPSNENANNLVKKSITTEREFEKLMRSGQSKCESYLNDIFGSENKMSKQKTTLKEIDFYDGEDFDVNMRLEMCDECEWHWINLDFWIDSRGRFSPPKEPKFEKSNIDSKTMTNEDFKREIKSVFEEIEKAFSEGDYRRAYELKPKLRMLNEVWAEKSNNAWEEVDKIFEEERKVMKESPEREDPYYWVKREQDKRKKVAEISDRNYQERKQFYLDLISKYKTKDYLFNQVEFERRLVEIFGEFGKEICDNNKDDNQDKNVDCADETCNGQICGSGEIELTVENETKKETRNLYCIMKECRAKEENITGNESACGNHICEESEIETCKEDCSQCKQYESINCSGKVIFKGVDKDNCPLEPICIEENLSCSINEDCSQPLCGKAECIEGTCKVDSLKECKQAECSEGQEKILKCKNQEEIVSEKCFDGIWKETGVVCSTGAVENQTEEIKEEEKQGNSCTVKEDCGNQDDVCSNGRCVTIPKQKEAEEEIILEDQQNEDTPSNEEAVLVSEIKEEIEKESSSDEEEKDTGLVGNVIKSIENIGSKVTGFVINGFVAEDSGSEGSEGESQQSNEDSAKEKRETDIKEGEASRADPEKDKEKTSNKEETSDETKENQNRESQEDNERADREEEEQRRGENERENKKKEDQRRNEECENNCEDNCERGLVVPCVQKCVFDSKCGTDCDSAIENCKTKCKEEKDTSQCKSDCLESCKKGEGFKIEGQGGMNSFEKAVFKLGGQCRISDEKTEGWIYFDGWGEPFEDLRYLKQEYYSDGSNDWCKDELQDYLEQRKEFEKSMNEEFLVWFFEDYMANTAEDWEEHASGIYDLYWKDVEFSKQIARTSQCSKINVSNQFNLINIKYESKYGKVEFWEELRTIKSEDFGEKLFGDSRETTVVTPFMKIWIFPPKEFIIYEMKKSMAEHTFPGKGEDKVERKNEGGPTEEEKEKIKQNEGFMSTIAKMSEKYGGKVEGVVQLKDSQTEEVVFNVYIDINKEDIITMKPMLPEETPQEDIKIEIDFDKIYEMIYTTQKEMEGDRIESPPWARDESIGEKFEEIKDGIAVYFKIKNILESAKITPSNAEKDVRKLLNKFFLMMIQQEKNAQESEDISKKLDEASKEELN